MTSSCLLKLIRDSGVKGCEAAFSFVFLAGELLCLSLTPRCCRAGASTRLVDSRCSSLLLQILFQN